MSDKAEVLLFDVNETLLDLAALIPHFEAAFGEAQVMSEWFGLMLRLSLVATVTQSYRPFDVLGKEALLTTASKHGLDLDSDVSDAVLSQIRQLPAHPDVIPGLTRLKEAGFRLATLTNSAPPALAAQMDHAGLTHFFERLMSVDSVQRFKPAPETYHHAAQQLGVPIKQLRLVAAHDWDVTGAIRAGAQAAFIARKGMVLGESAEVPDLIAPDLIALADRLI